MISRMVNTKKPATPTKCPSPKRRKLSDGSSTSNVVIATPDKNNHSFIKPVLRRSPRHLTKTDQQVVSPVRRSPRLIKKNRQSVETKSSSGTNCNTRSTPKKHIIPKGLSTKQIFVDGNSNLIDLVSLESKPGLANRNGNTDAPQESNKHILKTLNICNTGKVGASCNKSQTSTVEVGLQFKIPSPNLQSSTCKRSPLNITNSTMNSSNSVLKTPETSMSSTMKATPPLCKCGRRAKRKMVQSPGPNLGRFFFSCAGIKTTDRNGCGFFLWEPSTQISSGSTSRNQSFVSKYNLSGVSKPFTPVFQLGDKCNNLAQQRRSLGVRPNVHRTCIR
jgi:hypothetical protein